MKKLFLVLLAITSTLLISAQVRFGVKAGLSIANFNTSGLNYIEGTTHSTRNTFNGGVMASLPLFSSFYIQPELMYSGQGQTSSSPTITATSAYDYLNLPVLFKYQHASGLFAETGPQIGFLLSAKEKANGFTFDDNATHSIDFSWAFGLGYQIKTIPVGFNLRYNLGLTNTLNQPQPWVAKNSVFQIDLFYLFGGK